MATERKKQQDRERMQAKRKKIDDFIEFVRSAPVASGICCCGDNMDRHSDPSCGHSPVDQWDRSLSLWLEELGK